MATPTLDAAAIRDRAETIKRAPASARPAMIAKVRADVIALFAQLDTQLTWLFAHPAHPRFAELEARWIADLAHYAAASDVLNSIATQKEIAA